MTFSLWNFWPKGSQLVNLAARRCSEEITNTFSVQLKPLGKECRRLHICCEWHYSSSVFSPLPTLCKLIIVSIHIIGRRSLTVAFALLLLSLISDSRGQQQGCSNNHDLGNPCTTADGRPGTCWRYIEYSDEYEYGPRAYVCYPNRRSFG